MAPYYTFASGGGLVITYGFISCFRNQDELNSAYEMLREKSSSFTLQKFFNPVNLPCRFTLVIECRVQDMIEIIETYLLRFYSDGAEICLLSVHESEIDKMKPI